MTVSEAAPGPEKQPEEAPREADERRVVVTRRRAPRYRAFGVSGALVGIVAGLALGLSREPEGQYTQAGITGYFVAGLGLIGTLLGLAAALLVERRRR